MRRERAGLRLALFCAFSVGRRRLRSRGSSYRGSESPLLLRDRPTDGAAWTAKIYAGFMG